MSQSWSYIYHVFLEPHGQYDMFSDNWGNRLDLSVRTRRVQQTHTKWNFAMVILSWSSYVYLLIP